MALVYSQTVKQWIQLKSYFITKINQKDKYRVNVFPIDNV